VKKRILVSMFFIFGFSCFFSINLSPSKIFEYTDLEIQPVDMVFAESVEKTAQSWTFEDIKKGSLPPNFLVGTLVDGRSAGKWQVIDMKKSMSLLEKLDRRDHSLVVKVLQNSQAPSAPHVLAQLKNGGYVTDYNVVLAEETTATDFDLNVSFLAFAGRADMGGGLIWRAQDDQNYYIVRANPL
jgi:hypothetical protein